MAGAAPDSAASASEIPTAILIALVVAAGAFWGGAEVQKHDGSRTATATGAAFARRGASLAGGAAGATGFGGTAGGTATSANTTEGTVTEVTGSTLYLTDANGALVKVAIAPTTTVTRTGVGSTGGGGLQLGDTAIVRGTKGSDGTWAATSIIATAKGVSATSGFGGTRGSFGGGAGGGQRRRLTADG